MALRSHSITDALTRSRLKYGREAWNDNPASQFIPYLRFIDEFTIEGKNGELYRAWRVHGVDVITKNESQIDALHRTRAQLVRAINDPTVGLYMTLQRRKNFVAIPHNKKLRGFAKQLHDDWMNVIEDTSSLCNESILVICIRPRSVSKKEIEARDDIVRRLGSVSRSVEGLFDRFGLSPLGVIPTPHGNRHEFLEYVALIYNGQFKQLTMPRQRIDTYVPYNRLFVGRSVLTLRSVTGNEIKCAMLSIKEYPDETYAGIMDGLSNIPVELVVTHSYTGTPRREALDAMKLQIRRMDQAEDEAVSLRDEITDAIDDIASDRLTFGNHHFSVLIKGETDEELDHAIQIVEATLNEFDALAVRETMNLEAAFFAQLPGNFHLRGRKTKISNLNFASFMSFHAQSFGLYDPVKRTFDNDRWGMPLTAFQTTGGSMHAYGVHLPGTDLGGAIIAGDTGTGKTTLLGFLIANATKYGTRMAIFDKDYGMYPLIKALGGNYIKVAKGEHTGMNPLMMDDTPASRYFLSEWLKVLLTVEHDEPYSSVDAQIVNDVIDRLFSTFKKEDRKLENVAAMLYGYRPATAGDLTSRLEPFYGSGRYAWLFDNDTDTIEVDGITGFDLTDILEMPGVKTAVLMYWFHRSDVLLDGETPCLFVIEEAWKALDDPYFSLTIVDWEKTIRKRGGAVWFSTQSLSDIKNSGVSEHIIGASKTRFLMPDEDADDAVYQLLKLTSEEIETLGDIVNTRSFLLKRPGASTVCAINLESMPDAIKVLSARTHTSELAERLINEYGDVPENWLPHYL